MSGIAGIYYLDGKPASPKVLSAMMDTMAHRGLDGRDLHIEGCLGLGQLIRWNTPESLQEVLPLHDPEARLTLVADATIDNRSDLIQQLACPTDRILSDSELILAAYKRWGTGCADHLDGDFAFVIWDEHKREVYCARDRFGCKPLYYFHQPGRVFAFASEAKALLYVPEAPRRINEERLANYLANLYGDTESTIYDGIRRLPPSHLLRTGASIFDIQQYWMLEPLELPAISDEEYTEGFRDLFRKAVQARVRSAFPVGSQLSGGLDSSFVTCMARDILAEDGRGKLHTFSTIFDRTPESDERAYMNQVLETGGFIPHFVPMDEIGPISTMAEEYQYMDDASAGAHHLVWYSLRAAREAGVRVLLDGIDGDTVVDHGYFRFREMARTHRWREFRQEAEAFARRRQVQVQMQPFEKLLSTIEGSFRSFGIEELDRLASNWRMGTFLRSIRALANEYPGLNTKSLYKRGIRKAIGSLRPEQQKVGATAKENDITLIDPDFARKIHIKERIQQFGSHFLQGDTVRGAQLESMRMHLIASVFEPTNHAASVFGLEVRHPFFDRQLIQYCVSLPSEQSLKNGWNRAILRRAMSGVVPESIAWRIGKANMEAAFNRALQVVDGSKLKAALNDPGRLQPYVNEQEIARLQALESDVRGYDLDKLNKIASLSHLLEVCESRIASAKRWVAGSLATEESDNCHADASALQGTSVPISHA